MSGNCNAFAMRSPTSDMPQPAPPLPKPLRVASQQVEEDRFLALVVVIQARLRRAAGRGDGVHAGGVVALVRKALRGDVEDLVAFKFVLRGLRAGHARLW